MGLFINQGKQDASQDTKFDILVAENITAQIVGVKLAQSQPDTLEITFKILAGPYKGRLFWDRVNYNPTSDFSWKYRALRKAAGCPYSDKEGASIDIEALLLNKAVLVDLDGREGKNRKGEKQMYQNVKYKAAPARAAAKAAASEPAPTQAVEDDGSNSPFGIDEEPSAEDWAEVTEATPSKSEVANDAADWE